MRALALLLPLVACDAPPDPSEDGDRQRVDGVPVASMSFETFGFAREIEPGVSKGFNLDGRDGGCGLEGLTSPDGRTGINNSFGPMLPLIEAAGGQALEELVQREVLEGGFQMVLSWTEDEEGGCDTLTLTRTWGVPMTSPNGELIPGQTYDPHPSPDLAPIQVPCTYLEDGTVRADDLSLPVKLQIFSTVVDLPLEGGELELTPTSRANRWEGVIGGAIPLRILEDFVANLSGIGSTLPGVLQGILATRADMDGEDGPCSMMSAVMEFTTLPAFVFDEPPDVDWAMDTGDTDPGYGLP